MKLRGADEARRRTIAFGNRLVMQVIWAQGVTACANKNMADLDTEVMQRLRARTLSQLHGL